jgi:hypothetical protein
LVTTIELVMVLNWKLNLLRKVIFFGAAKVKGWRVSNLLEMTFSWNSTTTDSFLLSTRILHSEESAVVGFPLRVVSQLQPVFEYK